MSYSKPNSLRIDRLKPYLLGSISQSVLEARLVGRDVIDFSQANPDNWPPKPIIDKLLQAILLPCNHRYSSSQGISRLRDNIAQYYDSNYGVSLNPETEVVSVMGTKEGLSHLLQAIVDPGDTVILPTPAYPIHAAAIFLASASYTGVSFLDIAVSDDFFLTKDTNLFFERLVKSYESVFPRPRVLVISFPHNPSTTSVDISFFERVIDFVREREMFVVHDFAYSSICFDAYVSPSIMQVKEAKDCAIEFFSMSKGFGLAGWRIGFAVGNPVLVSALKKIKSYLDFGIFQPLQIAAADFLESAAGYLDEVRHNFKERRDLLVNGLSRLGWTVHLPKATVFVWAKIPRDLQHLGSVEVCSRMLSRYGVAASPGLGFGEESDAYVRFCLVETKQRIDMAFERMKDMSSFGGLL